MKTKELENLTQLIQHSINDCNLIIGTMGGAKEKEIEAILNIRKHLVNISRILQLKVL